MPLKLDDIRIFGIPVFGVILPIIVRRRIPLNRDGSFVEGAEEFLDNEVGYYYVKPWALEWLGMGWPLSMSKVYLTRTNEVVNPDFDVAG